MSQEAESPKVGSADIDSAEILDELTTNRGELKVKTTSLIEERNQQVTNHNATVSYMYELKFNACVLSLKKKKFLIFSY